MTPLTCLAVAIFFEARAEPIEGMEAVANVIINRVEDSRYPDTVCDVVWEPKQFSFTHDGLTDDPEAHTGHQDKLAWVTSQRVAKEALQGNLMGITSTHYHAEYVLPFWTDVYSKDGVVGTHVFYTNTTEYR
jgi:spore germination cell wall hydrolase CwlJ-like protein